MDMQQSFGYPPPEYQRDWFSRHIPLWQAVLEPFRNKEATFLEIGVFEGRSTRWLMECVLVHPQSRLHYIDTFEGSPEHTTSDVAGLEDRFLRNLAPFLDKLVGHKGRSAERLRELALGKFDFIHVDGSHTATDVLFDACLSWPLLKAGGLLCFDDYEWPAFADPRQCPKLGIDGFLTTMVGRFQLVHKGYQVWIRKVP